MDTIAVTIQQAVQATGISRTKIYAALQAGELPARKHGRRTLIEAAALRAWLHRMPKYSPEHRQDAVIDVLGTPASGVQVGKEKAGDADDLF